MARRSLYNGAPYTATVGSLTVVVPDAAYLAGVGFYILRVVVENLSAAETVEAFLDCTDTGDVDDDWRQQRTIAPLAIASFRVEDRMLERFVLSAQTQSGLSANVRAYVYVGG